MSDGIFDFKPLTDEPKVKEPVIEESPKEFVLPSATGPDIPGYSGAISYTPQDALADGSFDPVPPASKIVCLKGCTHYAVFCHEEPTADPLDWQTVRRICTYFHDDQGEMDMTDQTVFACSRFQPRWYNPLAWLQWIKNYLYIWNVEKYFLEIREGKNAGRREKPNRQLGRESRCGASPAQENEACRCAQTCSKGDG